MIIVTPSNWLKELVEQSFLSKYDVQVINNDIDLEVFNPIKSNFREKHNLNDKKIILGVANVWNDKKGLNTFLELSKRLNDNYKIILVGLSKKQINELPDNIIKIERTSSKKELAEIYSSADVFVNPTLEDNYPTVNIEAEACGTPVITYDVGGCKETIINKNSIAIKPNIDNLINHHVRASAPAFEAWYTRAERFLIKKYGQNSLECKKFHQICFSPLLWLADTEDEEIRESIKCCCDGLRSCKAILGIYLEDLAEEKESNPQNNVIAKNLNMDKIFIVHGHNGELKQSVARIIEKQEIEAIILSEQANQGRTIIEKFENYTDVGGAICLFTSDDIGKAKGELEDKFRARQNVVLETGYFMGMLGRNHVIILSDNGIEMPSDLSGVVYTNTSNWEVEVLKELKAMGYTIDFNKLF